MHLPAPNPKHPALGAIILAAGASTRMGRSKLLLPWDNNSVIGRLIEQWQLLGAAQIAVVCRADDAPLHAELDRLEFVGARRITNPAPERGMFSSIQCAANWSGWQANLNGWAIVLGDQPHLQSDTLRRLVSQFAAQPDSICQPVFDGHARHPVLLPQRAFAELRHTRAETLKEFLNQTICDRVECPVADAGLSLDLDHPEDYEMATNLYSGVA
jgi:molybdenum cofactor cytidylyltransferase